MITAMIVDDEPYSCESLATLLERYCPYVKLLHICYSGADALKVIEEQVPTLLFLDIEMPGMNGFEVLRQLPFDHVSTIFTTSYDKYAIKAIKFSALDYLLKPVDKDDLQAAVQKAVHRAKSTMPQQMEILFQKLNQQTIPFNRIAISTLEGLEMISVEDIISCSSDSNYTTIHLKKREKIIASRTLKEIEEMLEGYPFLRVHHSYIINLNEIEKYVKGDGGYLIMSDATTVYVSRSRKEMLINKLQR